MKKSILFLTGIFICISVAVFLFGQKSEIAGKSPKLFAEGIINTSADEYNPSFTPDGKTVYFTRRIDRKGNEAIMFSHLENGKWTAPQTAEFSGKFYDKEPFVSPDGKRLFFASMRPNGRDAKPNFDIWMVEKTASGWSDAKNLGANVNSSGYDNYPSVAADGTLYFASVRIDGRKDNDLYRSRLARGEYQKAENLGVPINTNSTEADPFIAPDQSYLIICSDREGGAGEGDLYISFNTSGKWTAPQPLGKIINTEEYEYTPLVFRDKFYFSRGWGDIYQIDAQALNLAKLKQSASAAAQSIADNNRGQGVIYSAAPSRIDKEARYLIYLSGYIVHDKDIRPTSPKFGVYEYEQILNAFKQSGFVVISEARRQTAEIEPYAAKVAEEVRQMLKSGVPPQNITVVGASQGGWIAMLVSTYLKNRDLSYVVIGACGADDGFLNLVDLHGSVLFIVEKTDRFPISSCQRFRADATGLSEYKEIETNTGQQHGFLYRPMKEWIVPTVEWTSNRK